MVDRSNDDDNRTPPGERQLTDDELREVRDIIQADKRAKWLWASIRTGGVWMAAVLGGATLFWDSVVRIAKAMVDK